MKTRLKCLILVVMFVLILCCALVACNNSNENETTGVSQIGDYLQVSFDENTESYTIVKCARNATDVELPSEYNGYPIKSIKYSAFYGCRKLISITIPDGITSIGERAFGYCTSLANITISDSVESIGRGGV